MKISCESLFGKVPCSRRVVAIWSLLLAVGSVGAADFNVTTPGGAFNFTINGVANSPTITLVRGRTYTFGITNSLNHPFNILAPGVSGSNPTATGLLTFTVPLAVSNYMYRCGVHTSTASLMGTILTIDPPAPPPIRIVGFSFDSNIVLRSTGTNTLALFPEFRTNLNDTNWFALTVQTNRFSNGTNETICGRPPGDALFIRIRAQ